MTTTKPATDFSKANTLRGALDLWLQWANGNLHISEQRASLMRGLGLCRALPVMVLGLTGRGLNAGAMDELNRLLKKDYGNARFPFGGYGTYDREGRDQTAHRNKDRQDWVRSYLQRNPE